MALLVTSAGVALVWPALAHNGLVISGAALIIACVLARLPSRLTLPAVSFPIHDRAGVQNCTLRRQSGLLMRWCPSVREASQCLSHSAYILSP
jgi:hypothetical protein